MKIQKEIQHDFILSLLIILMQLLKLKNKTLSIDLIKNKKK